MVCRSPELAHRMRVAAERLLDVLDPDQRGSPTAPFNTPDHQEWTYLPGPRPGLAVAELDDRQRGAAVRACSRPG